MIPNSLLRKWICDETETIMFLERKFLEGEESRSRFQSYQEMASIVKDCHAVLSGKIGRTRLIEKNIAEKALSEKRLNERHFLSTHREELKQVEERIQEAHRRLTAAQERRANLKAATAESMAHEKARWEEERRWMLRQLQGVSSKEALSPPDTTTGAPTGEGEGGVDSQKKQNTVDLAPDVFTARTNAALARARQVLAGT